MNMMFVSLFGLRVIRIGQALHKVVDGLSHLLHGYVAAADGLIEQQAEADNDGYKQLYEDDDK